MSEKRVSAIKASISDWDIRTWWKAVQENGTSLSHEDGWTLMATTDDMRDAYVGAREDLLEWKRRAQTAEAALRAAPAAPQQEPVAWRVWANGDRKSSRGVYEYPTPDDFRIWKVDGCEVEPLYAAPFAPPVAWPTHNELSAARWIVTQVHRKALWDQDDLDRLFEALHAVTRCGDIAATSAHRPEATASIQRQPEGWVSRFSDTGIHEHIRNLDATVSDDAHELRLFAVSIRAAWPEVRAYIDHLETKLLRLPTESGTDMNRREESAK